LEKILTGAPRPVDVGSMNDRLFLNVCGTGFDVTVLDYTVAAKKYVRGILPYLIGLVRAIAHYRPVHVRMEADGRVQERDVLICSVANGRFIGGGIPICPDAAPDDGLLDLVVVENRPRWMIPFYLPGLLMGKVLSFGVTSHCRCTRVELVSRGMRLNVDGEILSLDSASFAVQPGRLMLYW
ncbi:MAG: diacylglycerol/lipid kinase family protein, partial [Aristaeellaceae bacterium]